MGFFDKKKSLDDDDDEPVASVRPSAPKVSSALLGSSPSGLPKPARPDVQTASQLPRSAATSAAASPSEVTIVDTSLPASPASAGGASGGGFGIDDAVRLVRQLPSRDLSLVMQVVTKTLESVRVDVGRIIDGAVLKEKAIDERVALLRQEIERREAEILAAKREIAELEAEEREVVAVRERLMMAHAAPETTSTPGGEGEPPKA